MKGRATIAILLIATMPIVLAPVSLNALGVNPPPGVITEVYTGTNSYGSLDIYTATASGQSELNNFFSAADDSTISIKMNLLTHKVATTLPGGKIVCLPQSHSLINVTFTANSGQTWQVSVDGSGNMLTPNGISISQQAIAAIGGVSQATVAAFKNYVLAEGLVTQDPATGRLAANSSRTENIQAVVPFFTVACMLSLFDLIGATIGFVGGCVAVPIDPLCPFLAAWYYDALSNYYRDCVWG